MEPLGKLHTYQHSNQRSARRKRKRARNWKCIQKNNERKLPYLVNEIDVKVQEAQRVPKKMDLKRATPRHILIKMPRVKDEES